jgi:ABC-2 type transport system permease protein
MRREFMFLLALWKVNLLSIMEYRVAFLTQMVGMMLNNAVYFVFWIIFFDRFQAINGWGLDEMLILFGVVAVGFGLVTYLFGNVLQLSSIIASGQLDYYLSLPRPVLLHVLASRSIPSGMGDFVYGLLSFAIGMFVVDSANLFWLVRFLIVSFLAVIVFISFLVVVQSLAFWIGNANLLVNNAVNAIITFSLYPITLFDGTAKLLLFTLIPAAFVGAVPAQFVRQFDWVSLLQLLAASTLFLALALALFQGGLRRYESGSAIQVRL